MSSCPNINSPEWKALVNKIGNDNAWREFLANGYIPSADNYDVIEPISKETTQQIKPGVAELFESNQKLANAVYEALGFKQFKFEPLGKYSNLSDFTLSKKEEAVNFLQSLDGKKLFSPSEMLSRISNADTSRINKGLSDYLNSILEQYQGIYAEDSINPYRIEFKEYLKLGDDRDDTIGDLRGYNRAGYKAINLTNTESSDLIKTILHEFVHDIEPYVLFKESKLIKFTKTKGSNIPLTEEQLKIGNQLENLRKLVIKHLAEEFKNEKPDSLKNEIERLENGGLITIYGELKKPTLVYINNLKNELNAVNRLIETNKVEEFIENNKNIFLNNEYNHYGVTNLNEFITEALTNDKFRNLLNEIPYKNTTILSYLFELFQKILNIKKDTVLSEALNLIHELAITKREELRNFQITPQQKQQAILLYSQYLEQNPNGSIEQFKSWIKGDKREYKSSSASLPLRGGKKVEYKNASEFSEAINFLSQRFEINVVLNKLNDDTNLNVFGNTGPLGNYDAVNNTININKDEEIYEGVIVHEFIHGFSRLVQTYNKEAFRSLVDYYYNNLSTDTETLKSLWKIAYDYGNLETIPKTLSELPEGQKKDYIYDEIFTRLIEREYNENGSLKDFEKPSSIFYKLFELVKKFFGIKYNREKEFSKLTTSSTVKDFYNILKKVDSLKISKEEYIKGTNTNESIYNVYKILNNRKYEDLKPQEKEEVNRYMKEYNDYMKSLPRLSINQIPQERLKAIQEIFNSNPELSKIGDVFSYAIYLDTIFPDSKVKDIVYHDGGHGKIKEEGFRKDLIGISDGGVLGNGFYFYFDKNKKYDENRSNTEQVLINVKNPKEKSEILKAANLENGLGKYEEALSKLSGIKVDTTIKGPHGKYIGNYAEALSKIGIDGVLGKFGTGKEIVVFEPEQIHILSSKADIQGFKDFMSFENSEFSKYGTYQQFRDFITSKSSIEIENKLIETGKIDRAC